MSRIVKGHLSVVLVLILVIGVACRSLAVDTSPSFQDVYGKMIDRVTQTSDTADDVELANQLLKVAHDSVDHVGLLNKICGAIYTLGSRDPSGYDVAIESMTLVTEHNSEGRAEALDKIVALRQKQFVAARGSAKTQVGEAMIDALLSCAGLDMQQNNPADAVNTYRRAMAVASTIRSERRRAIGAAIQSAGEMLRVTRRIDQLKDMLKSNPKNTSAADELLHLLVVLLDAPSEAQKYSFLTSDQSLRQNISLAARDSQTLDESQQIALGGWYVSLENGTTDPGAKANMLAHASRCYQLYLEHHTASDLERNKIKMQLAAVNAKLAQMQQADHNTSAGGDKLVIWNEHSGKYHGSGALVCNIELMVHDKVVHAMTDVKLNWEPDKDISTIVPLPSSPFNHLRITIVKWHERCGGLAEVQVFKKGINVATNAKVQVDSSYDDRFSAKAINDGITNSDEKGGYWVAKNSTGGIVDMYFSVAP